MTSLDHVGSARGRAASTGTARGASTRERSYNTRPGSAHFLLFCNDAMQGGTDSQNAMPNLNATIILEENGEEIPISQNRPIDGNV
jgi:hypothetical protein